MINVFVKCSGTLSDPVKTELTEMDSSMFVWNRLVLVSLVLNINLSFYIHFFFIEVQDEALW